MKEFEKKLLLTEQEYHYVINHWNKFASVSLQTNYYFDTDDFIMNKCGITFRIREKNGTYKATIKRHHIEYSDCSDEEDLDIKPFLDPNVFLPYGVHLQGKLITERIILMKSPTCELVLDRNSYLGTVDYELEIEYTAGFDNIADSLRSEVISALKKRNPTIQLRIPSKSKSQRFFERKSKKTDNQPV